MNTKFLTTIFMLVLTSTCAFSQNRVCKSNGDIIYPEIRGVRSKSHKPTPPATTYNSVLTELTVRFPAASGGKVEIYRNGTRVVSANAAVGATLSYTLRCYGRGEYMVVVSSGKMVVYSGIMKVK